MENTSRKITSSKTRFVTLFAWGLVLIFIGGTVSSVKDTIKDLATFQNNVSSFPLTFVMTLFAITILLTPILLAIGFLRRRNWGRLGIMVISLLAIAMNAVSITLAGRFYPHQILWILFYLALFLMLRSDRIKREFLVDAKQEG